MPISMELRTRFEEMEQSAKLAHMEIIVLKQRLSRLENYPPLPIWANMPMPRPTQQVSATDAPAPSFQAK